MSKRTWKRRSIGPEAVRQALQVNGGNVTRAAAALGLTRESLSRWLRDDPSLRARKGPRVKEHAGAPRRSSFGAWVRRTFDLTPAESEILLMAEAARAIARDKRTSDTARLAAMREFRAAIRELDLPEVIVDGETEKSETSVRSFPRRVG